MIQRAKRYIRHLEEKKTRVMVPTPVLAEYLLGVPRQDRARHRQILERHFSMPALDIPSAELAADLQGDAATFKLIRQTQGIDGQSLRTDAMIIAIAVINKASKIITHDLDHFRKLAQTQITVEDIPEIQDQGELFEA